MAVHLSTYFWGEKRRPDEGLRISCTRYLPRGVPKARYAAEGHMDVWLPTLAPSKELVAYARAGDDPARWRQFVTRYKKEMSATDPRQVIQTLAQLATRSPISIGCSCQGEKCHRFVLEQLIRDAAAGKL